MAIYEIDLDLRNMTDPLDGSADDQIQYDNYVRGNIWPFVWNQTAIGRKVKETYAFTDALEARFAQAFRDRWGTQGEIKGGVQYCGVYFASRIEEMFADLVAAKSPELEALEEIETPATHVETEDEKFAALVAQVRSDIGDIRNNQPGISSTEIEKRKNASRDYRRSFEFVMQSSVAAGYGKTLEQPSKPTAPSEIVQFAHMLNDEIQSRGVPRPAAGFYTLRASGKEYRYDIAKFQELSDAAVKFELVR